MGLSLEEINSKFGDKVELELKDALDAQGATSSSSANSTDA